MKKNNPRISILNDDVLNVSMSAFKDVIGKFCPNVKFNHNEIAYHIISASASY